MKKKIKTFVFLTDEEIELLARLEGKSLTERVNAAVQQAIEEVRLNDYTVCSKSENNGR
jgi:hypothetical protein